MRKVIIRQPRHIAPFNEAARELRVLNKPLWQWQRDLLASHSTEELVVNDISDVPREPVETLAYSDNLWFDAPFLSYFLAEAKRRRRPTRAAFRASDPAFLQQGLRALTRSYERRGDLFLVDLWYFPAGPGEPVEPVIVPSDAREVGYYHIPTYMAGEDGELVWWLPERAVCAVDSWVHLLFINIVFGVFSMASRFEKRSAGDPLFRMRALWRSFIERKPLLGSSVYVRRGRNCSIDPTTIFQGPVVLGDNVTIGPGCVITQSIIGDNVTLTHGNHVHMSVISDNCFFPWGANAYFSVFMENSSVGQNAVLDMSVIGRNSYIGAGTIFTNFNLLPLPLRVAAGNHLVEIDMPVLGGCVGHNCRLGSGLVVYPARMIESDVVLFASPTRRVIMKNISYEESDHHATRAADLHPRLYPREDEQEVETEW
ncbi:MAG TPA: multidrug transporter [Chloroflexi bacterium]|nr:multidrug transporter [Chloroflexota bacterium]